jgi:hypothetical protein
MGGGGGCRVKLIWLHYNVRTITIHITPNFRGIKFSQMLGFEIFAEINFSDMGK